MIQNIMLFQAFSSPLYTVQKNFKNYKFNYKELSRYVVMYPTNLGNTRCPPPILAVVG